MVGVAPSRAIYFWSYSTTKKNINNNIPVINRDTPFVHVLSAASAGREQFIERSVRNDLTYILTLLCSQGS